MQWPLSQRVAFRFGVVFGAITLFPFPIGLIPKTDWLAEYMTKPFDWLTEWFGESVLGLDVPPVVPTGSGDTLRAYLWLLLTAILAAIGCAVWSALDERKQRRAYPRVAEVALIVLRYWLATAMLGYGIAKILELVGMGQMPAAGAGRLDQRIGDMSPMGMLWTFMGASTPYQVFAGLAEAVGGLLLLWRRTTILGAFVAMGVMTNVVLLNFCYDVPVKLYSAELLLVAGVIALPQLRRVIAAVLGRAVGEVPPRERKSPRWERARFVAKIAVLACIAYGEYHQVDEVLGFFPPPNELDGIWKVTAFSADGTERPPLLTDELRWRKLLVGSFSVVTIKRVTDASERLRGEIDATTHTLTVTFPDDKKEIWRYELRGDALTIDADHAGHKLHVTLAREPDPLLVTRGFHWVQEFPFNR
jgi:uncharacterized membrane protein YphA (DoxX/SURF4 family)